jgi:hypothetical protein
MNCTATQQLREDHDVTPLATGITCRTQAYEDVSRPYKG